MSIDLVDRLTNRAMVGSNRLADVLGGQAEQLVIEQDRFYTPFWDEAFVDLSAIVSPGVYLKLQATPKWVFLEDKACAFAVKSTDGGVILMSSGLLALIAFCAYHSATASLIAVSGAGEAKLREFEDTFLHIVINHAVHGLPLPDSLETPSAQAYQHIVINRDCMTMFVLLHELGHIDLGHLDGRIVGPIDFQPRVPDIASELHAAEIEADDFACRAFANADALNATSTLFTAWTYAEAGRRLIRGASAHLSLSHPLSINRLDRLAHNLSLRTQGSAHQMTGVAQMVDRNAAIVAAPAEVGLRVEPLSQDEAIARHRTLLESHRRIVQSIT